MNAAHIETMRRSFAISVEYCRNCISVTYDIAIVKVAMQIQHEERPALDNVFPVLGAFHLEMALVYLES